MRLLAMLTVKGRENKDVSISYLWENGDKFCCHSCSSLTIYAVYTHYLYHKGDATLVIFLLYKSWFHSHKCFSIKRAIEVSYAISVFV